MIRYLRVILLVTLPRRVTSDESWMRLPRTRLTLLRGGASKPAGKKWIANRPRSSIPEGTASVSSEIVNLIKTIVGAGVLGLPSGIASFADSPSAIYPALVLMGVIAALSSFGFSTVGLVCGKTQAVGYRDAWSRSIGERTAWIPSLACLMVTVCSVLCYSMILSDTIPALLQLVSPQLVLPRGQMLLCTTAFILLPLCLKKDLQSLAPFSVVGVGGMIYTAIVVLARWLTGSYVSSGADAPSNTLLLSLSPELRPLFGNKGFEAVFSPKATILVSMLSTAFMAHYNAPKMYWELRDKPKFPLVVTISFAGAMLLLMAVAVGGFSTFGASCQGLILNNYSVQDSWMQFSRAAVTTSLLCSYPLAFVGVRDGVLDMTQTPAETRPKLFVPITMILLAIITGLALICKDIGFVLALGGATWGNCIIYMFPALMLIKLAPTHKDLQPQVPAATLTGITGIVLALIGTFQALTKL